MMTCPKCQEEIGSMSMHYCPLIAEMPAKEKADDRLHPTAGSQVGGTRATVGDMYRMWGRKPPETQDELLRDVATAPKIDPENSDSRDPGSA